MFAGLLGFAGHYVMRNTRILPENVFHHACRVLASNSFVKKELGGLATDVAVVKAYVRVVLLRRKLLLLLLLLMPRRFFVAVVVVVFVVVVVVVVVVGGCGVRWWCHGSSCACTHGITLGLFVCLAGDDAMAAT